MAEWLAYNDTYLNFPNLFSFYCLEESTIYGESGFLSMVIEQKIL